MSTEPAARPSVPYIHQGPGDTQDKSFQPRIRSRVGSIKLRGTSCEGSRGKQIAERRGVALTSFEAGPGPPCCSHRSAPSLAILHLRPRNPFLWLTQSFPQAWCLFLISQRLDSLRRARSICQQETDQTRLEVGDPALLPCVLTAARVQGRGKLLLLSHRPGPRPRSMPCGTSEETPRFLPYANTNCHFSGMCCLA